MVRYVLASASPRRKELLEQIGLSFEISPANGEEIITENIALKKNPAKIVEAISHQKANEVANRYKGKYKDDTVVIIGADTLVAIDNEIMGKPLDDAHAIQMLTKLQGNVHQVYTGVTLDIIEKGEEKLLVIFHEKTDVKVYPITPERISAYVATGEHRDKAGAYAIQGKFAAYINKIDGDYNNVVGLPISSIVQELIDLELM